MPRSKSKEQCIKVTPQGTAASEWEEVGTNARDAARGNEAIACGSGNDKRVLERDFEGSATDAVTNICHALGQQGFSMSEIRAVLKSALETHYESERFHGGE